MVRLGSILADAQERGLLAQNVVRNFRATRRALASEAKALNYVGFRGTAEA
jgi:hypothetical protein